MTAKDHRYWGSELANYMPGNRVATFFPLNGRCPIRDFRTLETTIFILKRFGQTKRRYNVGAVANAHYTGKILWVRADVLKIFPELTRFSSTLFASDEDHEMEVRGAETCVVHKLSVS